MGSRYWAIIALSMALRPFISELPAPCTPHWAVPVSFVHIIPFALSFGLITSYFKCWPGPHSWEAVPD